PAEPAEQLAPKLPQLLLVGSERHRHTEGVSARLGGALLELDGATLDRHTIVVEVGVREAAFAVRQQRPEVARDARGRGRAPGVRARADLRVHAGLRRLEARLGGLAPPA